MISGGAILLISICVVIDATITTPKQVLLREKSFVKCILEIIRTYFDPDHPVGIISYSNTPSSTGLKLDTAFKYITEELLFEINSSTNWTVLITNKYYEKLDIKNSALINDNPYAVILIIDDDTKENIYDILNNMFANWHSNWNNPYAYIVLVDMRIPDHACKFRSYYQPLFTYLWKIVHLSNVVILSFVCDSNNNSRLLDIEVSTWLPIVDMDTENNEINNHRIVDYWQFGEGNGRFLNENVFPSKHVKDFRGSQLFVNLSYDRYFYPAYKFLLVFANSCNLNINLKTCATNYSYDKCDLFGPARLFNLDYNGQPSVVGLPPTFLDAYTFSTPNFMKLPEWQSILRIFTPSLWICVLISYLTITFTLYFIESFIIKKQTIMMQYFNSEIIKCSLVTMRPLIGNSVNLNFRHPLSFLLFSVWLFYCLQINTAYQSSLVDFMTNPRYIPPLRHIKDINQSNYKLTVYADHATPIISEVLKMAGLDKNVEYGPSISSLLTLGDNLFVDGRPCFTEVEDRFGWHFVSFVARKGVLWIKPFLQTYRALEGANIFQKWYSDLERNLTIKRFGVESDNQYLALNIKHFQGTLFLLILGLMISFIIFMCENVFILCTK
ncbi:hypothetical protein L9F63_024646 [Diploptera punctata]|uniref:Ionotropic glutamate receptor C-terminal domain-containing protein n=1 Tax=Diploptera punctata TaxID=6984 RepID=A0AAD7ZEJ5_DIPPU|nr:hypothetical protein L9F63_024646 [Diploptera punctata]